MPANLRSFVFSPVGSGASNLRIRTENTLNLENGKWYKLEFDLKTSDTADKMILRFSTGTAWPELTDPPAHLWASSPSGTPSLRHWYLVGMSSTAQSYYQQWDTQTYYILSDTDSDVYLHFQVTMKIGTDNYAVKLDNFTLSTDVTEISTDWTDVSAPATTLTTVADPTTDWSDA